MKKLFTLLLASISATSFGAEPSVAPPTPSADTIAPPAASRSRATSASTSQRLNAALPKFVPRKVETEPSDTSTDPSQPDGPRNAIIRLPQYDVQEDKLPEFRQRELLTQKGRADLAFRRHPGLKIRPFSFLNVRPGLAILAEEDSIDRGREMHELLTFASEVERDLPQNPQTGVRTVRVNSPK